MESLTPLDGPSNSSTKGVFLSPALDAGWNNKDKELVEGLGLNMEVNYLPAPHEESLISAAFEAYEAGKPFIMYFWTPHQLLDPRSGINIARMQLVEADDHCTLDPQRPECYYPADILTNIVSATLQVQAPRAYAFLKGFQFQSNDDQIVMLADVYYEHKTVHEAACDWVKANRKYVNTLVPQEKPLDFEAYNSVAGILVMIFAGILLSISLLIALFIKLHADHPVVLAANKVYCYMILLGSVFAYLSVFMFVGMPTLGTCVTQPLFLALGFVFMYCSLILKNFRIWRIFAYPFKPHLSNLKLAFVEGFYLALIATLLLVWFLVDPPTAQSVDNGLSILVYCQSTNSETFSNAMGWSLFSLNAILLLLGMVIAVKNRKVTSEFNESRFIGFAIYNIIIIGAVVVPLVAIPEVASREAKFVILCFGIMFSTAFTVLTLFVPKIISIHLGAKSSHSLKESSKVRSQGGSAGGDFKLEPAGIFRYAKGAKWPEDEKHRGQKEEELSERQHRSGDEAMGGKKDLAHEDISAPKGEVYQEVCL